MAEFAQRPMVAQGMPPSAPNAVGTGITSGLVPENNDPIIQQGMEQFASSVDGLYGKLDQAESMEDVMNSVRGDEQTMKTRVDELADLVGPKDAKKTPESVLAVMQPYFQILEMVQSQASDAAPGGIADAPMAGGRQANVNFNQASPIQAPGSDEAAMRISMGETPVNFRHGGLHPGENTTPFSIPAMKYMPKGIGYDPRTTNLSNVAGYQTQFQDMMKGNMPQFVSPQDVNAQRQEFLKEYLTDPRSKEEILAEQQGFFGDQDQQNLETQSSLALAKFGAQIANTPGSLLQALTGNTPEFATDLSKVAAQKADLDRKAKEFAYSTAAQEKKQLSSEELSIALAAMETSDLSQKTLDQAKFDVAKTAIAQGLTMEQTNNAAFNKALQLNLNANTAHSTLAPDNYGKETTSSDGTKTVDIELGFRTGDGIYYYDDQGDFVLMPAEYTKFSDARIKESLASGALDLSEASPQNFVIPDDSTPSGFKQVAGFELKGNFYVSSTGDASLATLAPEGYIRGTMDDVISINDGGAGRTFVTFKAGPNQGQTMLSSIKDGDIVLPLAFKPQLPVYKTNEEGEKYLASGNPLVVQGAGLTGVSYAKMPSKDAAKLQTSIIDITSALNGSEEVLEAIPDAIGAISGLKSFVTNTIAPFVPDSQERWSTFMATQQGKALMKNWSRTFVQAAALSDRYAVAEQEITKALAEDPEVFWTSPEGSLVRFQELTRNLVNRLEEKRAVISDRVPLRVMPVPSGSKNDPYIYSGKGQFEYVSLLAGNPKADLSNSYMRLTNAEARDAGFDPTMLNAQKGYIDIRITEFLK